MAAQCIQLAGQEYMLLPRSEYAQLELRAQAGNLPALPEPNEHGRYPAIEYSRISLARKLIQRRVELGLTQQELAQRARVRLDTVVRVESGKYSPSASTFQKIDRALEGGGKPKRQRRSK